MSYAKRLQGDSAASDKLAPPAAGASSKPAGPPPTVASGTPAAPPAAAPAKPDTSSSARAATAAPPPVQAPATPPKHDAAARGAASAGPAGHPGTWIVQLSALQDRKAASSIVQQLADKGYPAFVLDPAPGSPAIYRVQVGGYPDRAGAEQVSRRLDKEEHFKGYVRSR